MFDAKKSRGGGTKKVGSIPEGRIRCRPAGVGGLFHATDKVKDRRPSGARAERTAATSSSLLSIAFTQLFVPRMRFYAPKQKIFRFFSHPPVPDMNVDR